MEAAAANRRYDLIHKEAPYHDGSFESWAKEPSESHPFHARDGVSIWVTRENLTPDDDFLHQGLVVAAGQESGGEEPQATDQADTEG